MSEEFTSLTHISPGLTTDKLGEALTRWFGEDVVFTHWEYVSGTGKGDSYLSDVIKLIIHGKTQTNSSKHIQVVLKTIPKNTARRLTFRSEEFFQNEIRFYDFILPELLKFQSQKNLKEPFDNYANVFLTYVDGITDSIALEDLGNYDFKAALKRQKGLDQSHCKVTLKALAKFHAISFAMKDQKPEEFNKIRQLATEVYYHETIWDWYQRFWARISNVAVDAVEREYPNTIYVERIKKFAVPETYKRLIDAATNTLETGVISHGDSWTNNFLYKYQDGIPIDAKMIDFQLTRCASPVLDVCFFIYACTEQDLRLKYYKDLMEYYYEVLSKQVQELGTDCKKVYSRERFWEEVKKYAFFGLAFSFESTPVIILDPEDAIPMDDVKGDQKMNIDDYWGIPCIKSKEGRIREANNIVHCVDNGYI